MIKKMFLYRLQEKEHENLMSYEDKKIFLKDMNNPFWEAAH